MAGGGGAAAAGRSQALWLRCEGLMSGGFAVPSLEVTALAALVAHASWVLVSRPAIEAVGRWRP
jgi:hypothetical protein